jgi:hypothetical protein
MTAKHTPTPYKKPFHIEMVGNASMDVMDDDDRQVFTVYGQKAAILQEVLRACNSHEALVDALTFTVNVLTLPDVSDENVSKAIHDALKALKQAEAK